MQLDLSRAISNFKLRSKSILIPVYEAITNSIHANATDIDINFITESDLTGNQSITDITIVDNGDGFNKENLNSFLTLYSGHKIKLGAKGIGRLSFLKFFNTVKINSITNENQKVEIDFSMPFIKDKINIENLKKTEDKQTTINFIECKKDYQFDRSIAIDGIKEKIIEHFSILLFFRKSKNIIINIKMNQEKASITLNDIPRFKIRQFEIEKNNINNSKDIAYFDINYFIEKDSTKSSIDGYYCANERQVLTFQERGIELFLPQKNKALFFITSKYFDDRVNDARDEIAIMEKDTDIFNFLSFDDIKHKLQQEIFNILKEEFPTIDDDNKKQIEKFKYDNPELIGFIDENPKSFFIAKDEKERALARLQKEKEEFERKKNTKNVSREEIIQRAEAIGALQLVSYLKYRREIIEQFAKYDLTKEKEEEKVRNHILKRGLEGSDYSPISIKENNLWLLDDKFMSYNYAASEKAINTLLKNAGLDKADSRDKFDIGIYCNNENIKKVILVEMKKFTSNYKVAGEGINQLYIYATRLRDSGIDEIYLYLIAEVDEDFRKLIIGKEGFTRVFSQDGEIYQRNYNDVNAFVQVISPKALIADANSRNKTFLDFIINKQKV